MPPRGARSPHGGLSPQLPGQAMNIHLGLDEATGLA